MVSTLGCINLRAVVKNTFVHIEVNDDINEIRPRKTMRRSSDASHLRTSFQLEKLLELNVQFTREANKKLDKTSCQVDAHVADNLAESVRTVIKNTFFHVEKVEGACSEFGQLRRQSRRHLTDILHARDAEARAYRCAKLQPAPSESNANVVKYEDGIQDYKHGEATSSLSSDDDCNPVGRRLQFPPSAGSVAHSQGLCRPCVWFLRPSGCIKGSDCEYCHLCDEVALAQVAEARKDLKKLKKRVKRAEARRSCDLSAHSFQTLKLAPSASDSYRLHRST